MRSCIYCGRELGKDEVCNCPQSVARRMQKQSESPNTGADGANTEKSQSGGSRTTYKTGYTGSRSRFDRAKDRYKAKKAVKRPDTGGRAFFSFVKEFIKAPVDKIINPPRIGRATMLFIAAAEGAVGWLSMFFLYTGMNRSVFGILGKLLGFGGIEGYSALARMVLCALLGAVSGIVLFFMYTGVFWLINRFIFKSKTEYWDFSTRLSLIGIPFTVLGALGVALSIFSLRTLMLLLVCGLVSSIVLMYEALKTEWINRSSGAVMYAMMGGLFILFTVILNLIR